MTCICHAVNTLTIHNMRIPVIKNIKHFTAHKKPTVKNIILFTAHKKSTVKKDTFHDAHILTVKNIFFFTTHNFCHE